MTDTVFPNWHIQCYHGDLTQRWKIFCFRFKRSLFNSSCKWTPFPRNWLFYFRKTCAANVLILKERILCQNGLCNSSLFASAEETKSFCAWQKCWNTWTCSIFSSLTCYRSVPVQRTQVHACVCGTVIASICIGAHTNPTSCFSCRITSFLSWGRREKEVMLILWWGLTSCVILSWLMSRDGWNTLIWNLQK